MAVSSTENTSAIGAALPFQPNPFQLNGMPLFERNDVPSYLFRVYGPNTAGETTGSHIIPLASSCDQEKRQDIFRLQPSEAARRLNEHMRWWRFHELECNLMSWTGSLLFALQYGLYRHHTDHNEPSSISKPECHTHPPGVVKTREWSKVLSGQEGRVVKAGEYSSRVVVNQRSNIETLAAKCPFSCIK